MHTCPKHVCKGPPGDAKIGESDGSPVHCINRKHHDRLISTHSFVERVERIRLLELDRLAFQLNQPSFALVLFKSLGTLDPLKPTQFRRFLLSSIEREGCRSSFVSRSKFDGSSRVRAKSCFSACIVPWIQPSTAPCSYASLGL